MRVIRPFGKSPPPSGLRLTLCDKSDAMTDAWLEAFYGVDAVEIVQCDLLETGAEAVLSPANSFGDMSGGVDKRIDDYFGGVAQEKTVSRIRKDFYGELPVGVALLIPMQHSEIPYLVVSPTMRVPAPVPHSLNAYLAMRAALVAVQRHNEASEKPIRSLALPGLCTGVGAMPFSISARQMRTAYENVVGEDWKRIEHPAQAPFAFSASVNWTSPD